MPKPSVIPFRRSIPLDDWPPYPDSEIASGARGCRGKFLFADETSGLMAGVWEAEANIGRWVDYPWHEVVIVLDGEVVMAEPDRETVIGPGEAFVIAKGTRCAWHQAGYVRKFFMAFASGPAANDRGGVFKFDPQATLDPSTPPAPEMLHSPVPVQHARSYYTDPSGQFSAGLWDTTGYHRKLIDFPRHELMHLIEGSVTFTDAEGRSQTFNAGDTFFVPCGTPNSWKSEGYLRKIYCILQPKP